MRVTVVLWIFFLIGMMRWDNVAHEQADLTNAHFDVLSHVFSFCPQASSTSYSFIYILKNTAPILYCDDSQEIDIPLLQVDMGRRTRIDLGQSLPEKEVEKVGRQRQRWAARHRGQSEDQNPFIASIAPNNASFGDNGESYEEIKQRLDNLEFGNFPGYFNYRNKAASNNFAKATAESAEPESHKDGDTYQREVNPASPGSKSSGGSCQSKKSTLTCGLLDNRLKFLRPEWFAGKEVLDIGCNRGHITYAIAHLFSPKLILGIDIDPKIVQSAIRDLRTHMNASSHARTIRRYTKRTVDMLKVSESKADCESTTTTSKEEMTNESHCKETDGAPCKRIRLDSNPVSRSDQQQPDHVKDQVMTADADSHEGSTSRSKSSEGFPNNIFFVEHNYVLAKDELLNKQQACFDTIVCLSVTKWIHLNYRDEGLKRFFKRIYNHLKAGGLLVLEVQPFVNYGRRKKLSDRLRANYYTIKFKPDQFDEYLLSKEVGFKRILASTTTEHQCAGFKRPLKVFEK